jgi:hypothetical protein
MQGRRDASPLLFHGLVFFLEIADQRGRAATQEGFHPALWDHRPAWFKQGSRRRDVRGNSHPQITQTCLRRQVSQIGNLRHLRNPWIRVSVFAPWSLYYYCQTSSRGAKIFANLVWARQSLP